MKKYIVSILIISIFVMGVPGQLAFAETEPQMAPQTMDEAKSFGLDVLSRLPEAAKDVWQNQALPIWMEMWGLFQGFWASTLGPIVEVWWEKLLGLLGKDTTDIKKEFEKEKKEMQKDIWDRFKNLLK